MRNDKNLIRLKSKFKDIRKRERCADRLFNLLKELLPKRLYIKGINNVTIYVLLALSSLIAIALAAIKIGRRELMRRITLFRY